MSLAEFYALVAGLITLLATVIIVPLVKSRNQHLRDELTNVGLVKARLEEMRREVNEGVLSQDDFQSAQDEVKIALLDEQTSVRKGSAAIVPALIVGLLIALVAGGVVYQNVNHIDGVSALSDAPDNLKTLSAKLLDPQQAEDVSPQDIQSLALAVRLRLREEPDDAQGWMFLGRLRMTLGQLEESVAAFERSLQLRPDSTMTRVSFAQALMMSGTDEGLNRAQRVLKGLLAVNENNDNLSLMMAVTSAQLGQNDVAMPYYIKVRDKLEPSNPMRVSLDQQLGLQQADKPQASDDGLELQISLAPELTDKLPETGMLLVFVRPDDAQSGVPLAVKRLPLSELPVTLTMGDEDAMMSGTVLSDFANVNVTARVSDSPDVMAKPGDLQGNAVIAARKQGQIYQVVIEQVIQ